ncbi:hypothetical protein TNCT_585721 [Trichonephila clavata]|uniref:Uncharacterized protein n=1 Tax=Trichonephila clavata TaxID=2740835 RepID=A0A8X6GXY5_TRICU|nr:hypothetical protein TNCT_585721 [Trichonephila clavata]
MELGTVPSFRLARTSGASPDEDEKNRPSVLLQPSREKHLGPAITVWTLPKTLGLSLSGDFGRHSFSR